MRLLSRAIYKSNWITLQDDKCVIDSNAKMEQVMSARENAGFTPMGGYEDDAAYAEDGYEDGGFSEGLGISELDALTMDTEGGSAIIKASAGPDLEALQMQADTILEQARLEAENLKGTMLSQCAAECEAMRANAQEAGYQEGLQRAMQEEERLKQQFDEMQNQLELQYQKQYEVMEPLFIDTITDIYEHIFNVELSEYRQILTHLIDATLRKVEGSGIILVHVSAEDFPIINMEKKSTLESAVAGRARLEIVEDIGLQRNQCLIETDCGLYDCGLDTQLGELTRRLKVLSYEKN